MTGWRGVIIGRDRLTDCSGDQESASLGFVDALRKFLGVKINLP